MRWWQPIRNRPLPPTVKVPRAGEAGGRDRRGAGNAAGAVVAIGLRGAVEVQGGDGFRAGQVHLAAAIDDEFAGIVDGGSGDGEHPGVDGGVAGVGVGAGEQQIARAGLGDAEAAAGDLAGEFDLRGRHRAAGFHREGAGGTEAGVAGEDDGFLAGDRRRRWDCR